MDTFWEIAAISVNLMISFIESIYNFSYLRFGFEGRLWVLIVPAPSHCSLFIYKIA